MMTMLDDAFEAGRSSQYVFFDRVALSAKFGINIATLSLAMLMRHDYCLRPHKNPVNYFVAKVCYNCCDKEK